MLLFVTGASGSGKTTVIPGLVKRFPEYSIHDFDERGVPDDADTRWRQEQTEYWINKAIENQHLGQDTIICGGAVFGEILACPSIHQIEGVSVCLLDCGDMERIDRIRSRGQDVSMDMLSWAAWLRVHAIDPEWYPQVIRRQGYDLMRWANWEDWKRGDQRWRVPIIDTSGKKIEQIIAAVGRWIETEVSAKNPLTMDPDRPDEDVMLSGDRS